MPTIDPPPVGTCLAYAAHPDPTRSAAGLAVAGALAVCFAFGADVVDAVLEHAARPKTATAASVMATTVLRLIARMK
jgi:hypothetical protein